MNAKKPEPDQTPLGARLRAMGDILTKSEAVIARWLILNEATLALETGSSIAAKTGVSEITVSRFSDARASRVSRPKELKLTRIHHLRRRPTIF